MISYLETCLEGRRNANIAVRLGPTLGLETWRAGSTARRNRNAILSTIVNASSRTTRQPHLRRVRVCSIKLAVTISLVVFQSLHLGQLEHVVELKSVVCDDSAMLDPY